MPFFKQLKHIGRRQRRESTGVSHRRQSEGLGDALATPPSIKARSSEETEDTNNLQLHDPSPKSPGVNTQATPAKSDTETTRPVTAPSSQRGSDVANNQVARAEVTPPVSDQTLSQKLWDDAYDILEQEEGTSELIKTYVNNLAKVLRDDRVRNTSTVWANNVAKEHRNLKADGATDALAAGAINISAELKDRTKRQIYMKTLVEKGQAKISRASKISGTVGTVAKTILLAKPVIDLTLQNIPQAAPAALPWAGACVGLQILANPAKATRSNLEGVTHVTSRMEWYCVLTDHLLDGGNAHGSLDSVLKQLEQRVLTLYKAILLYQIKSVCSYYNHQGLVFIHSLMNPDEWNEELQQVVDAEKVLLEDWKKYDEVNAQKISGRLVELTETMEKQLGDIRQTLWDFTDWQGKARTDDENYMCLKDLRIVNPQDDMTRIENKKEKLLLDAHKWILEDKTYTAFTNWDESNLHPCRLLWVHGPAGTGKTMLLISIIRQLSDQPAVFARTLSYFFCQSNTHLDNATAIIRSLIWMLIIQQPHLISHLQPDYKSSGRALFNDMNASFALSRAFVNMLKDVQPVYFVVDALDECDQGLEELIELISTSLNLSNNVRWLVSSRPDVDLLQRLNRNRPGAAPTLLELDVQSQKDGIEEYIKHRLCDLKSSKVGYSYTNDVLATVTKEVGERAERNFLWVSLVFNDLRHMRGSYAVQNIKDFPPGLSRLYDHKMTKIDGKEAEERRRCWDVLMAFTLAYRLPLSLSELSVLVPWSAETDPLMIAMECDSFLTVESETVNVNHKSAKDYLKNLKWTHRSRTIHGHADVLKSSINAMSDLKKNQYALQQWDLNADDIGRPDPDPLARIEYSFVFWLDHLRDAIEEYSDDSNKLCELAFDFLKVHFLHWLESLGLLRKLPNGIVSVRKLLGVIQSVNNAKFSAFLRDANRFMLYSHGVIDAAPLQAYASALVFAPQRSVIRQTFKEDTCSWISQVPIVDMDWSSCLYTLVGHDDCVTSVTFSSTGERLASGSRDRTIKVWDTGTGECIQTLKGHDWVNSVAFSATGERVASGAGHIRIWDIGTGECLQTLEGHIYGVTSVAFSNTGERLSSGSVNKTVEIWDMATGECIQSLEGHDDSITSVTFSSTGERLASGSRDCTIKIWNLATGKCTQTLKGHSDPVNSVAFSATDEQLASASDDHTIKVWDMATGECVRTLKGHQGQVKSVAFSATTCARLASGSNDKTVKVWDTATGECTQTFQRGNDDCVSSVAFSVIDDRLASGSHNNTIRIWDTAVGECQQPLERDHSDKVSSLAFSTTGEQLASGSNDRTIKIWDTVTGECVQTLQGHDGSIKSVAFSATGERLASDSADQTVKIWDTTTGECIQTLHTSTIYHYPSFDPIDSSLCSHGLRIKVNVSYRSLIVKLDASPVAPTATTATAESLIVKDRVIKYGYGFSTDNSWMTQNGQNILWLPPEFRPACSAIRGQTVSIGCRSGRVLIFGFSSDG